MSKRKGILGGTTLGLSISESSDIEALGFSETHFQDIFIEFARYMIATGATLAYGGDFRAGGFTETLYGIKSTYQGEKIESYLGWPLWLGTRDLFEKDKNAPEKLSTAERDNIKTLMNSAVFHYSPMPSESTFEENKFLPPIKSNVEIMYIWARSMSMMRSNLLAKQNDAQVMLGGRLEGYSSKYPGVVEEAYEVMKAGKPIYLIGAFGGGTMAVIDALLGNKPSALTEKGQFKLWDEWGKSREKMTATKHWKNKKEGPARIAAAAEKLQQAQQLLEASDFDDEEAENAAKKEVEKAKKDLEGAKKTLEAAEKFNSENPPPEQNYKGLIEYFNANKPSEIESIDYRHLTAFFEKKGISGLNNGLTEAENKTLFDSQHVSEMISLVLKGLMRTQTNPA